MNIATYNDVLKQYNAQWQVVGELRANLQAADAYLASYGVAHHGDELQFRMRPIAAVTSIPPIDEVLRAVTALTTLGEQVVSTFNRLSRHDQYLVKLPHKE